MIDVSEDPGFCVCDGVFRLPEMARIQRAIDQSGIGRTKAGARHLLQIAEVRALAADPRLLTIACQLLGGTAFPFRATLFDKSLARNWLVSWHQDTALPVAKRTENPHWGPWTMKAGALHAIAPREALQHVVALRVQLDDSTLDNGPLRVLPGTHIHGVIDRIRIQEFAAAISPVECVANAGSVVAIRPLVLHASSKARVDRPRRVVHIEYATRVQLDRDVDLAIH